MFRLTKEQIKAMKAVKDGADVYAYGLAKTLRGIEKDHPGMVDIGKPQMYRGSGADQVPYFGAILTKQGRKAIRIFG